MKEIKYIYNTVVKIEDPRKRTTVVQCTKCQQYGHTKNNCLRPYRCVKCAEGHKTADCPKKDKSTHAKCALCLGNHPANYKGCEVYKEIASRRNKARRPITRIQTENKNIPNYSQAPKQPAYTIASTQPTHSQAPTQPLRKQAGNPKN